MAQTKPQLGSQANEFFISELTHGTAHEGIKQATDPIIRKLVEIHVPLASGTELESFGYIEATSLRHGNTSVIPLGDQHDARS